MDANRININTIDEYISAAPKAVQGILKEMRRTIRSVAPQAEETISYRMPAFKLKGKILIYFAAFKKHIGLYPPVPKVFRNEVSAYAGPKGNLQFPLDAPLPLDLIKRIVQYRANEILTGEKRSKNQLVIPNKVRCGSPRRLVESLP